MSAIRRAHTGIRLSGPINRRALISGFQLALAGLVLGLLLALTSIPSWLPALLGI